MKCLSIGEFMLEFSNIKNPDIYQKKYAGDSFNFAYYFKSASPIKADIEYLSAVGKDQTSKQGIEFLLDKGIPTNKIMIHPDRTIGCFIIDNDEHGEKIYSYWRTNSAACYIFEKTQDLSAYDMVFFSGISLVTSNYFDNFLASIKAVKDKNICFDFNLRLRLTSADKLLQRAQQILPMANFIKISDEELVQIYPHVSIMDLSKKYPLAVWVCTRGANGVQIYQNGELLLDEPLDSAPQVDASGAGDCFFGYFLANVLLHKYSYEKAIMLAHSAAKKVVAAKGSIVEL